MQAAFQGSLGATTAAKMKYPFLREGCIELLPGQYFDKETNTHYNYFRDYDPSIGRYVESDPIGLNGGINIYAYVGANPLKYSDPFGLWRNPWDIYKDAERDAQRSGFPGPWNGIQDAYRHCLASCMMAKENGQTAALLFGWLNEKKGDWWQNQEEGERKMDDFNNACGRNFGRNPQDCKSSCRAAASSGGLQTYQSGSTGGYWY